MSPTVPTSNFSRLSLENMGPSTRSHRRVNTFGGEGTGVIIVDSDPSSDDGLSDVSIEEDDDDEEEDTRTVLCSPNTNISYDISSLDPDTQSEVRQLFRDTPPSEAPPLALQWCQFNQDQEGNRFYAFQLHELVPRSIRIGSPSSKYSKPKCYCMKDSSKPCKHLIYLLDQLNSVAGNKRLDEPVQKLGPGGAFTELDKPFEKISAFHLDLLASSLHCNVGSPDQAKVNSVRLEETREILAAVAKADADDYAVKQLRPDIFEDRKLLLQDHAIITPDDLTQTVANMLMTNNDFFAYFLKLLGPTSRARDPFRAIQRHIDRIFAKLDAHYRKSPSEQTAVANSAEGPRDVAWAAAHIHRAVSTVHYLLQNRQHAPSPVERASAARTLVRIMHTVVTDWNRDLTVAPFPSSSGSASAESAPSPSAATEASNTSNNLYLRLVTLQSDPTSKSFILDTLAQLPEQNQWIETLEDIEAKLVAFDAPEAYLRRLRELIALMRSSGPVALGDEFDEPPAAPGWHGAGSKRSSGEESGRQGGPKRAK